MQGVTGCRTNPRVLIRGEAAADPLVAAGSTQVPTPAVTSNVESAAPLGASNRAEIVRRVQNQFPRGIPLDADRPVGENFSV